MPCVPDASKRYGITQADLAEGCEAIISDITFFFATTDHKTVSYISTTDPKFRTTEGIHIGSTLIDVLSVNGSAPIEERGWAFYSLLPALVGERNIPAFRDLEAIWERPRNNLQKWLSFLFQR